MYTVDLFLKSGVLPWHRVLGGKACDLNRPIRHISVIELPVDVFVRPDELVLTTALGHESDDAVLPELIEGVHRAGASALFIAVQANRLSLSDTCRQYADEHDFPVVLIPWECRFADLTEHVLAHIREDTTRDVLRYEGIQKKLLSSYLQNRDLAAAAQILADELKTQTAVLDASRKILGASGGFDQKGIREPTDTADLPVVPLETNERLYGYFCMEQAQTGESLYHEDLFRRYLLPTLVLWFDREWAVRSARQSARDDFVWKLAKGSEETFEELAEQARALGLDLRARHICIVGQADAPRGKRAGEHWAAANADAVKEALLQAAGGMRRQIMAAFAQGRFIVYLQSTALDAGKAAHKFLDQFEARIKASHPGAEFWWGISEPTSEKADYRQIYNHAKLAQELCRNSATEKRRYSYENTIIFGMLTALSENREIKERARGVIEPIIARDAEAQTDLVETLRVYLREKNISQTARTLHLHRQSLLYRLTKIEELTGLSLKDADNLFLLELCLRLYLDFSR